DPVTQGRARIGGLPGDLRRVVGLAHVCGFGVPRTTGGQGNPLWRLVHDSLAAQRPAAGGRRARLRRGGPAARRRDRARPALAGASGLPGAPRLGGVGAALPANLGRALVWGCEGVIVPTVTPAAQAQEAAGACRYPPAGYRSGGGAMTGVGEPFCLIMVESV